eukprot:TRINITY_DN9878_c0_g2_i1.p1 TRINITY_DN9878_c0_g2~~TRINITY_DN9878_c0_g2_i1.p1  ORF type:complete len:329 (-),score=78.41 TRINITY_DN9878_c0_g2_i1:403-1389(-)
MGALLGFRAVQGFGMATVFTVGNAMIADVYEPALQGWAFGWLQMMMLVGPIVGPIIGGAIANGIGWRGNFYVISASAFLLLVLQIFVMPESLPKDLRNKASPKPWRVFVFFTDRRVAAVAFAQALAFFSMFVCQVLLPLQMAQWGLSQALIGVTYVPMGVGLLFGPLIGGRHVDRLVQKSGLHSSRLWPCVIALGLMAIPQIIFGFTLPLHIAAPLVTCVFTGFLFSYTLPGLTAYIMGLYPMEAGLVSSTAVMAMFAAGAVSSATAPMARQTMGGWFLVLIEGVQLLALIPLAFVYFAGVKSDKAALEAAKLTAVPAVDTIDTDVAV